MAQGVFPIIVIPLYNHAATLRQVVLGSMPYGPVLVVDDGSTELAAAAYTPSSPEIMREDAFPENHPLHGLPVYYLRHSQNQGKGRAIMTAASAASTLGMTHLITLDADGQHDPDDIPLFLEAIAANPMTLFVGKRNFAVADVPGASRFGRWFSNFWLKVQTGVVLGDSQSGFRAYPLEILNVLTLTEARFSFEIEVLVRAAWAGFSLGDIPIRVYYQKGIKRISHFHPFWDNLRLTILNTRLTIRCIMPVPQKQYVQDESGRLTSLHPLRSLRILLSRNETPKNIALAGGLGVFIGTLPIFGVHSLTIILVLGSLRLNKLAGLATSQLCMPPFVPAICIEVGHYLLHGSFLTELSLQTLGYEALSRLWEWVIGSFVMAPVLGLLCGAIVYLLACCVRQGMRRLPEAPS